jgi:hypothetical protein
MKANALSHKTVWEMLTEPPPSFGRGIRRLGGYALLSCIILSASMGPLTFKWSGWPGIYAMVAAMGVSLLSNVLGAVPACLTLGRSTPAQPKEILSGMLVRGIVLLLTASPLVLSELLPQQPVLLWLAGSYFVVLMVETSLVATWMSHNAQVKS